MRHRLNPFQVESGDFGATGRAQRSRPNAMVQIAIGSLALGRETVVARRYSDATLFDRLASRGQISDSQLQTAEEVLRRYVMAQLEPRVTASYAPKGWLHGNDCSESDDDPEHLSEWLALMLDLPAAEARAIEGVCHWRHPGVIGLVHLQAGLDRLGPRWGVRS